MYYRKEYLKRAHREIDTIFRVLFPEHGMAVREEQILLCHEMLDNLLGRNIALIAGFLMISPAVQWISP